MESSTTGGRALAIAAGALFTSGALMILLDDVLLHGAAWQVKHGLTVITVAGTIMAGHLASAARAQRHWLAATGFAALVLAGTGLTVYQSVGRQAEHTMVAAAEAAAADAVRARATAGLASADAMLTEARQKFARECETGKGTKCDGIKATIEVYEAAVKGHRADLADAGPVRVVAPEARRLGEIAAALGYSAAHVEAGAILLVPFLLTLFLELGAIVSLGYGLRHRPAVRTGSSGGVTDADIAALRAAFVATPAPESPDNHPDIPDSSGGAGGVVVALKPRRPDTPRGGSSVPQPDNIPDSEPDGRKADVLAAIQTELALGRTIPRQRDLCERHGVARSTMSDWLAEWERDGSIPARRAVGRCKALTAS